MKYTNEQKKEMYLDYFNNYLTVDLFAEHNQIDREEARELLSEVRLTYKEKYK